MSEHLHGHADDHGHPHGHPRTHGHGHDHGHGHSHGDGSSGTAENPHAGQGSVLLDIGGDTGALVVFMPEEMLEVEIEIRPADSPAGSGPFPHVAVVSRPSPVGPIPSLVYPALTEGRYELYEKGTTEVEMTASVRGGHVTEVDWGDADAGPSVDPDEVV